MNIDKLKQILEAVLLAAGEPVSLERVRDLFQNEETKPSTSELRAAFAALSEECVSRGVELREVASGFCYQAKSEFSPWVKNLWQEKAPRYSRALLETLAIIAYRQPITRSEIEEIRGVAVSTQTVKTLLDREWVRVLGQREVPGRPSIYGTTKQFLDHFNLTHLEQLPALREITDLDAVANGLSNFLPAEMVDVIDESTASENFVENAEKNTIETENTETVFEDIAVEESEEIYLDEENISEDEFDTANPIASAE